MTFISCISQKKCPIIAEFVSRTAIENTLSFTLELSVLGSAPSSNTEQRQQLNMKLKMFKNVLWNHWSLICKLTSFIETRLFKGYSEKRKSISKKVQQGAWCRAFLNTDSTDSIEPVDFWRMHNEACEIAKIIRIQSVDFQDMDTLEPVIIFERR